MIRGRSAVLMRAARLWLAAVALLALPVEGQEGAAIRVFGHGGDVWSLETSRERGYLSVPLSDLERLGWEVERRAEEWRLTHSGGASVRLVPDWPLFHWNDRLQQLVDAPYLKDDELWVPAQLVLDFMPFHMPDQFGYELGPAGPEIRVGSEEGGPSRDEGRAADTPETRTGPLSHVVVIDPGHGGRDLGAVGPAGTYEKDVALAIARALARDLGRYPELDVRLTRDSDELVPLWRRGEWATEVKGDRPGIFVSIHLNALPDRTSRGYETYFLSEARTDHERRVAAMENAPATMGEGGHAHPDSDLGGILNELRNLDYQHWSALLAEMVQDRLGSVHPGPDRGVKQGPFAVITNALMPSVLVELGFISNREEERMLGRSSFQDEVGAALARAVIAFFERYPPGNNAGIEGDRLPGSRP